MFELDVNRGDALIFDGSLPHGQGPSPSEETWTIFVTLHEPGTFEKGFPDETLNQSVSIYRDLTYCGEGWQPQDLKHFYAYPMVLQQVQFPCDLTFFTCVRTVSQGQ